MPSRARLSSLFTVAATTTAASSTASARRIDHVDLFASAARARSGTLAAEDAHHLFDELLRRATPIPERALSSFLTALARAPPSTVCSDGPTLAITLFNRLSGCPAVAPPTLWNYNILIDCCSRAGRPNLGLAYFGRLLTMGLGTEVVTFNNLLKCLGDAKRMDEALDVLLHRMPELGCMPNDISYSIVLKRFCNDSRSQQALELLRMMAENGRIGHLPGVNAYNTVIHGFFMEGEVAKACDLFHAMMRQGISPDVVTYNSVINALSKARAMDKVGVILQQMIDKGVQPNIVTWNSFMDSLCKHGRIKEARDVFDSMAMKGQRPDIFSYCILLHAYATDGCMVDLTDLFNLMIAEGILPNQNVFNTLINAYAKRGLVTEAMNILKEMTQQGVKPDMVSYSTVIGAFCRMGCHLKNLLTDIQSND
jgi:pentatricopeptide repeat protein